MSSLSDLLERHAGVRQLLVLLVLVIFLNFVMGRWTEAILEAPGAAGDTGHVDAPAIAEGDVLLEPQLLKPQLLDLQFLATPDRVHRLVSSYGPVGRVRYRWFSLTIDMIYPLVYSLFLAGLISILSPRALVRLNLVPTAALLFDVLENAGVAVLLTVYPAQPGGLARAVTVFTTCKWIAVTLSAGLVVLGVFRLVFSRRN